MWFNIVKIYKHDKSLKKVILNSIRILKIDLNLLQSNSQD